MSENAKHLRPQNTGNKAVPGAVRKSPGAPSNAPKRAENAKPAAPKSARPAGSQTMRANAVKRPGAGGNAGAASSGANRPLPSRRPAAKPAASAVKRAPGAKPAGSGKSVNAVRKAPAENKPFLSANAIRLGVGAMVLLLLVLGIVLIARSTGNNEPSGVDNSILQSGRETIQDATAAPDPQPSPTPAIDYSYLRPSAAPGMLPVFWNANTTEKKVAITVDDLNQPDNMKAILDLCERYNAKITIFTLGQNVKINTDNLRRAYEMGIEIENHGFDHSFVYSLEDDELITQIGGTGKRVSDVLGVNYRMHFMRPPGGNGRNDPRLHAVLKQGGFYGVAYWSLSGQFGVEKVLNEIKPGDVILYHTTDEDVALLTQVIPGLAAQGYEMVTMNELFGYPANEVTAYDDQYVQVTVPLTESYSYDGVSFENGTRAYGVKLLQERLAELGYLKAGSADGDYGNNTEKAVKRFQKNAGLKETGVADDETRARIYADDAPKYK
ncbi:MAG: polysaccharide deacetylase family protein [Clostridia bacterium]|nr:polysaccharide deacetylase family protein [Clostridia bacterium]